MNLDFDSILFGFLQTHTLRYLLTTHSNIDESIRTGTLLCPLFSPEEDSPESCCLFTLGIVYTTRISLIRLICDSTWIGQLLFWMHCNEEYLSIDFCLVSVPFLHTRLRLYPFLDTKVQSFIRYSTPSLLCLFWISPWICLQAQCLVLAC